MSNRQAQIAEIISNPDYRQFAVEMTRSGRQVEPDGFPCKHMGMSDNAFLALPLKYEVTGELIPMNHKKGLLRVVRVQEERVIKWWQGLKTKGIGASR